MMNNQDYIPNIFLSYAKEDKELVLEIYDQLAQAGTKPWIDEIDLLPGQMWKEEITKAINNADFAIIFLSSNSVSKRGYVQKEFKLAVEVLDKMPEDEIFIIPVRLDDCIIPDKFKDIHCLDFFKGSKIENVIQVILKILDKKYPTTRKASNSTFLNETTVKNPIILGLMQKLNAFDVISKRMRENATMKIGIAKFFWDYFMPRITESSINKIYFESGSSTSFLAHELKEIVKIYSPLKLQIATNDMLTYLDFTIDSNINNQIKIKLLPDGTATDRYGAIYGELAQLSYMIPDLQPKILKPMETETIELVANKLINFLNTSGLVFIGASGIDFDYKSDHFGPHVGGYYNKLLKRALLSTKCPTVLIMDESKLFHDFQFGRSHSVCSPDFMFSQVIATVPFAFVFAFSSQTKMDQIKRKLDAIGVFYFVQKNLIKDGLFLLLASNELFKNLFNLGE